MRGFTPKFTCLLQRFSLWLSQLLSVRMACPRSHTSRVRLPHCVCVRTPTDSGILGDLWQLEINFLEWTRKDSTAISGTRKCTAPSERSQIIINKMRSSRSVFPSDLRALFLRVGTLCSAVCAVCDGICNCCERQHHYLWRQHGRYLCFELD